MRVANETAVKQIVKLLQDANYVQEGTYPKGEPDMKLYFRKNDGFIMAGRFYSKEGILNSPEGPILKVHPKVTQLLQEHADCSSGNEAAFN